MLPHVFRVEDRGFFNRRGVMAQRDGRQAMTRRIERQFMKRFVLFFTLLFSFAHGHGQGVVLPPDTVVIPPTEEIAATAKAFSGRWEGLWDQRMPHVLVVEKIKSNTEAVVLYAWQEPPVANGWKAGWARIVAAVDGNTLRVPLRDGIKAWYELLSDGTLKAGYLRANSSTQSNAVLRKVQP